MTNDNPTAPVLPPCPFCPGTFEWSKGTYGDGEEWIFLACDTCEAMVPTVAREGFSKQMAIDLCSTRAPLDPAAMLAAGYVPLENYNRVFENCVSAQNGWDRAMDKWAAARQQVLEEVVDRVRSNWTWDDEDVVTELCDDILSLMDTKETDDAQQQ